MKIRGVSPPHHRLEGVRPWLRWAAVFAATLAAGCGGAKGPSNLLLVTLDTVRADRIGAYGYAGARTPVLDRLAERGVLFEAAFCQAPLTLPSHVSLLTGTYPFFHGVRDNGYFTLTERATTLAEVLGRAGYDSAAFIGGYPLDSRFGLDQGFALYDDELSGGRGQHFGMVLNTERPASESTDRALAWLKQPRAQPFFLWMHYYDPHAEYLPPPPFDRAFAERPYDGEIAYVDQQLGRLIAALGELDLERSTVIAAISDHGESLGEHGEYEHGLQLYDNTARVPWILALPDERFAGRRVGALVETVDLMPTVLELLGQKVPRGVQGLSAVPLLDGRGDRLRDAVYLETYSPRLYFERCELLGWRDRRFKYIRAPRPELYDLQRDPAERDNIVARAPERARRMDDALKRFVALAEQSPAPSAAQDLDPEAQAKLESLGYLAGSSGWKDVDLSQPCEGDPKQLVPLVSEFQYAERLARLGRWEEAKAHVSAVLELDPENRFHGEKLTQLLAFLNQQIGS